MVQEVWGMGSGKNVEVNATVPRRSPTAAGSSVQGRSLEVDDEQQRSSEEDERSWAEAGSLSADGVPQAEVVSTEMDRACGHFGPEAAAEDKLLSNLDLEETMHWLAQPEVAMDDGSFDDPLDLGYDLG